MKDKINALANEIMAEAKRQEEQRKEYISIVKNILESTEKTEDTEINGKITWRLTFKIRTDMMNETYVSFSQNISDREKGLSSYDAKCMQEGNENIEKCINDLYDKGINVLDDFIKYLTKTALPMFLQDRHSRDYRVRTGMFW